MGQLNSTQVLCISIAIPASILLYNKVLRKSQPAPFPPGPKPLPLIGNLRDFPKTRTYKKFEEWSRIYGDIVHVDVLGYHIIVLNDVKYVHEMLESKSRIYSERPTAIMAGKLVGWEEGTALRQTDGIWSEQRKYISNFLGTRSKAEWFEGVIHNELKKLLHRIQANPGKHLGLFQAYAGSVVLTLIYGYEAVNEDDPFIDLVTKAMENFAETTQVGAFAVDTFPVLRFIPSWFPGAGWKAKAMKYRKNVNGLVEHPYHWTKNQMHLGIARPCFLTDALEGKEYSVEQEKVMQWTATAIYTGAAHTTAAALSCFILGAVKHTAELQRAQAEIQAVVGNDRLPTLEDRPHLPYFEAFCMEIHRWYTLAPLGLQHVAREDDIQNGYFIPKGAILITNNLYAFYRNGKLYPEPGNFSPERFLEFDANGRRKQVDPRDFLFGYGRRACPGMHLANAMLWQATAALITVFDFKPVMKDGKAMIPSPKFVGDIISHFEPFDFIMTPKPNISHSFL